MRKTYAKDGVKGYVDSLHLTAGGELNSRSFFRGMGSPLVGVTPMFAVSFWVRCAHPS